MRVLVLVIGAVLATLAAVGLRSLPATATTSGTRNYVSFMSCDGPTLSAGFTVPSVEDVRSVLDEQGIAADPDAVWIDLSLFDNGFAAGTFLNAGPFVPMSGVGQLFSWSGLLRDTTHFYRLNAHVADRWIDLGRASFKTPDCDPVMGISCNGQTNTNAIRFEFPLREPQLPADAPPSLIATLSLAPIQNWIDLSLQDNGFAPGTFLGARTDLPTAQFQWGGILPNAAHFYRWNTQYSDGNWYPQRLSSFTSLACDGLPSVPSLYETLHQ